MMVRSGFILACPSTKLNKIGKTSKDYRCILVRVLRDILNFTGFLKVVVFWKIMREVNGRPDRGFSADRTALTAATRSAPQFQSRPQH